MILLSIQKCTYIPLSADNPPGPDKPQGPYPTIVTSKYGHKVLVTQASAYCKYVGNITIYLDKNGEIAGHSGAPIFLSHSVEQGKILEKFVTYKIFSTFRCFY